MNVRFLSNTSLARTEMEMQMTPGFRPRRSGVVVSRFAYAAERCSCRDCTYRISKKNFAKPTGSTCFSKSLVAGCVPLSELLEVFTTEVNTRPFTARVSRLLRQVPQLFWDHDHWLRYEAAGHADLTGTAAQASAVFLLTADPFLWSKARLLSKPERINFSDIRIRGVDVDGYVLFYMAKDLYSGTMHVSLSELTDPELVSDEAFRLIVTAFLIRRYGSAVLCSERCRC